MNEKILLIIGFLQMAVSVPFFFDKIKPNKCFGIRTRKTLSDVELWYAANRRFATWFYILGLANIVVYWDANTWSEIQQVAMVLVPLGVATFDTLRFVKNY